MNYIVVGGAIFYASRRSDPASSSTDSEADLASRLAEGSYACLYLISALSTLISSAEGASEIAGLARRVTELLDSLGDSSEEEDEEERDEEAGKYFWGSNAALRPTRAAAVGSKEQTCISKLWAGTRAQGDLGYEMVAQPSSTSTFRPTTDIEMSRHGEHCNSAAANKRAVKSSGEDNVTDEVTELLHIWALDVHADLQEHGNSDAGVGAGQHQRDYQHQQHQVSGRLLVRGLSLCVCEGMRVLVTGPSGCGKSTLLRTIARALRAEASCYPGAKIAVGVPNEDIVFCPQTPYLFKVR